MNSPSFELLMSAAALQGEFRKTLLALGVLALLACIGWGIQEWGVRKSSIALGWLGLTCLAVVALGACVLLAVSLL